MNRAEAYILLNQSLDCYREKQYGELAAIVDEEIELLKTGTDAVNYTVTIWIRYRTKSSKDIVVSGTVGLADWSSPHDRFDDAFIVPAPK